MQEYVWNHVTPIYGDVEAGKHWFHTFVSWLKDNIMDYKQALSDPYCLYSPTYSAATAICTDDCLTALPSSQSLEEENKALRFSSRTTPETPTDFKGPDIVYDDKDIYISQSTYACNALKCDSEFEMKKEHQTRLMTEAEVKMLRSDADTLACFATRIITTFTISSECRSSAP